MTQIVQAGNVMYPCLFVIKSKGYTISTYENVDGNMHFKATKGDNIFAADSAEAVLGLIAMLEIRGPNWSTWSEKDKADYDLYFATETQ